MESSSLKVAFSRFLADYGMLLVLLALCLFFSVATYSEQHPSGASAADQLAREILSRHDAGARAVIVARKNRDDAVFAETLGDALRRANLVVVKTVTGNPRDARTALQTLADAGGSLDVIACNRMTSAWAVFDRFSEKFPSLGSAEIVTPKSYWWPNFLKTDNLLNVANQIAVIAIIAIGMTMVIITAGIDLSVGSLIALSAVVDTWLIRGPPPFSILPLRLASPASATVTLVGIGLPVAGMLLGLLGKITLRSTMSRTGLAVVLIGTVPWLVLASLGGIRWLGPTPLGMTLCCLSAVVVCGVTGAFSGAMITLFGIPPFIVTLAMMLVASGLAYLLAEGQSIYQVPDSFVWLGRGADLLNLPNAVVLMVILYVFAHLIMSRTKLGRYIYAVGGNREAARLSGVPVRRVLLLVYTVSGGLAGLGGVVMASQLRSGAPTYGVMYELYVIAAVVVGGTSLAGGEGKIFGTLIGALIIAVIQNGMNLTNVESYTQKVVLGLVILGAVLADTLKQRGWRLLRFWGK